MMRGGELAPEEQGVSVPIPSFSTLAPRPRVRGVDPLAAVDAADPLWYYLICKKVIPGQKGDDIMHTTTATIKGQITIPAILRKKLNIRQGTRIAVREENGKIIMEPLPDDIIKAGRGMLRSQGRAIERLLADRKFEAGK